MARFGNPSGSGKTRKDHLPSSGRGGPSSDAKFKRSGTHGFLPRGTESGHATRAAAEKAAQAAPNQGTYSRRVVEISTALASSHFAGDGSKHRFVVVAIQKRAPSAKLTFQQVLGRLPKGEREHLVDSYGISSHHADPEAVRQLLAEVRSNHQARPYSRLRGEEF